MHTLLYLFACAGSGGGDTSAPPGDDTATTSDSGAAPAPEGAWIAAARLVGDLTFTVSPYDGEGLATCSYTRHFDGVELVGLVDYACPDCGMAFGGDVTVSDDGAACFDSWFPQNLSYTLMNRAEFWGWKNTNFYRSSVPSLGTSVGSTDFSAPGEGEAATFSYSATSTAAETALLEVEGSLSWSMDALLPDPAGTRSSPYLCGWPQGDPGNIDNPAAIALDRALPNLPMEDQCGEPVSLRDFTGEALLFVAAYPDCDACVYTALTAATYATAHDLRMVVLFEGDDAAFAAATQTYGALGPVLRNRNYIEVMSLGLFGYTPVGAQWWLADPSQVVVAAGVSTLDFSELNEVL